MQIKIHRGFDQIGGCITEISTNTSRVFIDMGQNLPGVGTPSTPEQDKNMVDSIFSKNKKEYEAVIYSHAHEDHVGLFSYVPSTVPQYIGEGGKMLLLAKYELIKKGNELSLSADTTLIDAAKIARIKAFNTWPHPRSQDKPMAFMIGDIRITPFFNCHSIYDSYMFLIEAQKQRIWHTGDYREHGYMGKGLFPTLKCYARNIDVLITEGTMLTRYDKCIHEREVSHKMQDTMKAFKYVIILASATDIERLAAIKEAAKKVQKELYICSTYMKRTMSIFTRREAKVSQGLFSFHAKYVRANDNETIIKMKQKGFVLISGVTNLSFVQELCKGLQSSGTILIYSSWDGYYKDSVQVAINPGYKNFRDAFQNVVDIHTSGHADRSTIKRVIETVNPQKTIIIHKEKGAEL